jgi:hypothetical protein
MLKRPASSFCTLLHFHLPVLLQGEKKEEKYCFRAGGGGELRC